MNKKKKNSSKNKNFVQIETRKVIEKIEILFIQIEILFF